MIEYLDGIDHEVAAMRALVKYCVDPSPLEQRLCILQSTSMVWRSAWTPCDATITVAYAMLSDLRGLIAAEQLNYARTHDGRHICELGLMSIKVATTREHVDRIRKMDCEHAKAKTNGGAPRVRHRKADQPVPARDTGTGDASGAVAARGDSHPRCGERDGCNLETANGTVGKVGYGEAAGGVRGDISAGTD